MEPVPALRLSAAIEIPSRSSSPAATVYPVKVSFLLPEPDAYMSVVGVVVAPTARVSVGVPDTFTAALYVTVASTSSPET